MKYDLTDLVEKPQQNFKLISGQPLILATETAGCLPRRRKRLRFQLHQIFSTEYTPASTLQITNL